MAVPGPRPRRDPIDLGARGRARPRWPLRSASSPTATPRDADDHWAPILEEARRGCRAQVSLLRDRAKNVLEKSAEELRALREAGLGLLYIGPESGDDATLKAIAKGSTHAEHVAAAQAAHAAGMKVSVIVLLGVAGTARSREHAEATGDLLTAMDPEYIGALTTTVVPKTPLHTLAGRGRFTLPTVAEMLGELRTIVDRAAPRDALFRTNHASNYLALGGRLPADRRRIVALIDQALAGAISLRPEWMRGL
ncbi:MAG: hypothetical protein R3B09_11725 [Nannocystaceae bacterium]